MELYTNKQTTCIHSPSSQFIISSKIQCHTPIPLLLKTHRNTPPIHRHRMPIHTLLPIHTRTHTNLWTNTLKYPLPMTWFMDTMISQIHRHRDTHQGPQINSPMYTYGVTQYTNSQGPTIHTFSIHKLLGTYRKKWTYQYTQFCRLPMCSQMVRHIATLKADIFQHAQSTHTCNTVTTSFKERHTDSRCPQSWRAGDTSSLGHTWAHTSAPGPQTS